MAIEKSAGFMGNIERAISLSKWTEIGHITAEKPVKVASRDGATLFTAKVGIIIDTNFPTKAGNTTTTVVVVPLDGAKEFAFDGGKVKMDGIAPFIYQGRGVSHVFTVVDTNGDVMKKNTSRRSSSAEIDEIKKQLAAIAAMLAAK